MPYILYDTQEQYEIANANPIRYRGYYYDNETGYYYLQSRYYDPSICRFINSDIPQIAQISKKFQSGLNLFAYCCNDPINRMDPSGMLSKSVKKKLLNNANSYYNKNIRNKGIVNSNLSGFSLLETDADYEKNYEIVTISYLYKKDNDRNQLASVIFMYGKVSDFEKLANKMFNFQIKNLERQIAFVNVLVELFGCTYSLLLLQSILLVSVLITAICYTFNTEADSIMKKIKNKDPNSYYGYVTGMIKFNNKTGKLTTII